MAQIEFVALFPLIEVYATYDINSTHLVLPKGEYKISAHFMNLELVVAVDGEFYENEEEEYFELRDVVTHLNYNETKINFHNIKHLLSQSELNAFAHVWPLIENRVLYTVPVTIADEIETFADKIYNHFPARLLFPK